MLIFLILLLFLFFLLTIYKQIINRNNSKIIFINSDGNCFFRAISAALNNKNQSFHKYYRYILFKSLIKYPLSKEFMSDEEIKFIYNIKYDGIWIDSQLAILRLSDILQRDILFLNYNKYYNRIKYKDKKPIYLIWKPNLHYDLYDIVTDTKYNANLKINL